MKLPRLSPRDLGASIGIHVALFAMLTLLLRGTLDAPRHAARPVKLGAPRAVTPSAGSESARFPTTASGDGAPRRAAGDSSVPAIALDAPLLRAAPGDEAARIRGQIESRLRYPLALRRRGVSGSVTLALVIAESGALESVAVASGSGQTELDELALTAAREAAPFGKNKGRLEVSLPIQFKVR